MLNTTSPCPLSPGSTVWGYLRDSGGDRQERSVTQQREMLEAYCQRYQLVLEAVYEDEARPGSAADDRAGLTALLAAVEAQYPLIRDKGKRERKAQQLRHGIVFWSLSRLARDSVLSTLTRADLRARGLTIASLSDEMLTGDENLDPILEALLDWKSDMDLEVIGREARRGLHHVVSLRDTDPGYRLYNPQAGEPTGAYLGVFPGVPPTGYRAEPVAIGKRRDGSVHQVQRLVRDTKTWRRVRLAWKMRVEDQASYREIHETTRLLTSPGAYSTMLANRIYTGVLEYGSETYGRLPDDPFVEPIIPASWYEMEMARRAKRARRRRPGGKRAPGIRDPRGGDSPYLLSGLLRCARCGRPMYGDQLPEGWIDEEQTHWRRAWRFYQCAGYRRRECDAGKVGASKLERFAVAALKGRVLNTPTFKRHLHTIGEQLDTRRGALDEALAVHRAQLEEAARTAAGLAEALAARPTSPTLLHQLDEAEAEQRRLGEEISRLDAERDLVVAVPLYTDEEIDALIRSQLDSLSQSGDDRGNVKRARRVLAAYIDHVDVEPGKPIRATLYFSFGGQGLDEVPPRGNRVMPCPIERFEVEIPRG